jgi:hypothetical protein
VIKLRNRFFSRQSSGEDIKKDIKELKESLVEEQTKTRKILDVMLQLARNQELSSLPPESTKTMPEIKGLPELKSSFFSDEVESLEKNFESLGSETVDGEVDLNKIKKLKKMVKGDK